MEIQTPLNRANVIEGEKVVCRGLQEFVGGTGANGIGLRINECWGQDTSDSDIIGNEEGRMGSMTILVSFDELIA